MFPKCHYQKRSLIDNIDQVNQYPSFLNHKQNYSQEFQEDKDFFSEIWTKFNEINLIQMQKELIQSQKECQKKYIKSININKITKQLKIQMTNDGSKSWLKHQHLGLPLRIFCDLNHPYDISFSLNPNPEQKVVKDQFPKTQIKWFSIDQQLKRPVLQQTKFGQILFKADYMMKILTLGLKQGGLKFKYPQDLAEIFQIDFDSSKQKQISRFFLKVNEKNNAKIISLSEDKDFYKLQLQNPVIQVQARNVNIQNGKIIDKPVQDQNSRCYVLAKRFSQCYDVLADQYSIFNQLKGAIIGLALAKWFQKQKININKKFIDKICNQQFIQNYQKTLPFIKGNLTFQKYNTNQFSISIQTIYRIGGFDGHLNDSLFSTNKIKSQLNSNSFRQFSIYQKTKFLASFNTNFTSQFQKSIPLKENNCQNQKSKDQNQKQQNFENGREMIKNFQISSPSYYQKKLSKPNYPGGKSGVTIGIGYDLGQTKRQDFKKYWKDKLSDSQYKLLQRSVGLQGEKAHNFIKKNQSQLNKIKISMDKAIIVFNRVIQTYEQKTQNLCPGIRQKYPNTFNSLVQMHYNRGFATQGQTQEENDRRRQVKRIRDVLTGKDKQLSQFQSLQAIN